MRPPVYQRYLKEWANQSIFINPKTSQKTPHPSPRSPSSQGNKIGKKQNSSEWRIPSPVIQIPTYDDARDCYNLLIILRK
jgi:hypothetical protein